MASTIARATIPQFEKRNPWTLLLVIAVIALFTPIVYVLAYWADKGATK